MEIDKIKIIIQAWALQQPAVTKVWLYGSRVRGDHRPDSDLDVAVQVCGERCIDEQFSTWMRVADSLSITLGRQLPMEVQVEWFGGEEETEIVCRGLRESSILVYESNT